MVSPDFGQSLFSPPPAQRWGGVGGGGGAAYSEAAVRADRPPTPDPSPPRARARGGRGKNSVARSRPANSRHCERSEAIHGAANAERRVDCFVASAPRNDDKTQRRKGTPSHSRRMNFFARGIHLFRPSNKGRGECRAADAPDSRVCNGRIERTHGSRSHRNHPALPTQWFTDYTCAPRCSGFLATVTGGIASANLTPASRCQDYTTSPSARKHPRQKRHPRPPHPAPRFATIMIRPFEWDGMAGNIKVIWFLKNGNIFSMGTGQGKSD